MVLVTFVQDIEQIYKSVFEKKKEFSTKDNKTPGRAPQHECLYVNKLEMWLTLLFYQTRAISHRILTTVCGVLHIELHGALEAGYASIFR